MRISAYINSLVETIIPIGSVITVTGGMDDDGYYIASCGDKTGMVPANFIQEIELRDKELITRLTNKVVAIVGCTSN